jgi:hypothetical protein
LQEGPALHQPSYETTILRAYPDNRRTAIIMVCS